MHLEVDHDVDLVQLALLLSLELSHVVLDSSKALFYQLLLLTQVLLVCRGLE